MKTKWIKILTAMSMGVMGAKAQDASVSSTISPDGAGKIVVEARGQLPEMPTFFTVVAETTATVHLDKVEQKSKLVIKKIQGDATTFSLGLNGTGEVSSVTGEKIQSWSIRQVKNERFLDLEIQEDALEVAITVQLRSTGLKTPGPIDLLHLAPGKAVGFSSIITVTPGAGAKVTTAAVSKFFPTEKENQFQTTTGGKLSLNVSRRGSISGPVEFESTKLDGNISKNRRSANFQLTGKVRVSEPNAKVTILSGNAAVSDFPDTGNGGRLRLNDAGQYELLFPKPGEFSINLNFVASVSTGEWSSLNFEVASGSVAPIQLSGMGGKSIFQENSSIMPEGDGGEVTGFIPASGKVSLSWKASRKVGDGKLFFSTVGKVDASVGAGLMRQNHQLEYKVLQGELEALAVALDGPGEVLGVEGTNLLSWKVTGEGGSRTLEVTLSQPIKESGNLAIRTQTPLDAFPVRMTGLRATPVGAVRHSGYVRVFNQGSVRLEPTGLSGLTQLSPDQFPGDAIEARQMFVYRFPAADYNLEIAADRIQPEVGVSETVVYQVAETDRRILAAIELDIREAPIREFDVLIPDDYSVVSITGAPVADYVVATEAADGSRNLKVLFQQEVSGRQLLNLNLEKNEAAIAGGWNLPKLKYPSAKSVQGDVGISAAPGYRIAIGETELLVEKPVSYFPTSVANLQQAFRIRETDWAATIQIEVLEKSVQADVFHLYSLSEGTAFGSVLVNFSVTGSPVSEWRFKVPADLDNILVEGKDVRTFRRVEDELIVSLHQPVIGAYTLLVTFEENIPDAENANLSAGRIVPVGVQAERGFVQVVSPIQVKVETATVSDDLLSLDTLELPAEFQLLSSAPSLGVWQYTERPFELNLVINWYDPGTTVTQVVEFSKVDSEVSRDGEVVTDLFYYVKSRGSRALNLVLPDGVKLWAVSVAGRSVTARESGNATLVPLPGGIDPNIPVEVRLRLGKPAVDGENPLLALPIVDVPVLKTEWKIAGDKKHVLVPSGGSVEPAQSVLRPTGFNWVGKHGLGWLLLIGVLTVIGAWLIRRSGWIRAAGLIVIGGAGTASVLTAMDAFGYSGDTAQLQLSLPVLAAGDSVALVVRSVAAWQVDWSWIGIGVMLIGVGVLLWSISKMKQAQLFRIIGGVTIALGLLMQRDSAAYFYGVVAAAIFALLFLPAAWRWFGDVRRGFRKWKAKRKAKKVSLEKPKKGAATAAILIGGFLVLSLAGDPAFAQNKNGLETADSIVQTWNLDSELKRVTVTGKISLTGGPGDEFVLLRTPAVLTEFKGVGIRLSKQDVPGLGLTYMVVVPEKTTTAEIALDDPFAEISNATEAVGDEQQFEATFTYQFEVGDFIKGFPVPTGSAAVQKIDVSYDKGGWEFASANAMKIEHAPDSVDKSSATILLAPRKNPQIALKPKARDMKSETTQFYVETLNAYVPGPGVVDGRHRINVRPSQGVVSSLEFEIPEGLTVGAVSGPVGVWQFDADSRKLLVAVEPAQSRAFDMIIETQRGLAPLPTDLSLAPISVVGAAGEVGLIALAFGADAQPEKVESEAMSAVNLGDFDVTLLPGKENVLHRVFRYGVNGGELTVRVAPVASEVRVVSKQVISLGEERVVLGVQCSAEITRAGLFQLSFPLPDGMEVESLTGAALRHWSELSEENGSRIVVLHLNGKTIGVQEFALTLTGPTPPENEDWEIPRFSFLESNRQTGDLVIRPTTGLRLQAVSRKNVSEVDPRSLGGESKGALAFRLLQQDWNLEVGIEKLDPRVTGKVLHEVTLREGQTKTVFMGDFLVENASIRSLKITLPQLNENEIKTLRASGDAVSDLVRTADDSDVWELQFKRRIVGPVQFRLEFDRRGDRTNNSEILIPAAFPEARQLLYHYALRTGGRLEMEAGELTRGWQRIDWNLVPESLREAGNRNAPVLTLKAISPDQPLTIAVQRHSLADALKLRVAGGDFTTVLSPTGDELTLVDLTMEVIQRSSLSVGLPKGAELFSIFVNGESMNTIRQNDSWQFHILPGADDRTANVRLVYSVPGESLKKLQLTSPVLDVPLENIRWNVLAPKGFEMTGNEGNLQLVNEQLLQDFDRNQYIEDTRGSRQKQAQRASQLLDHANQLLQAGQQSRALWALSSVANQHALDAASNEDARVQLENLQTQQAMVGLNTRRQRLYLDNSSEDVNFAGNEQIKLGAEANPVLQKGSLNFNPQELTQLLQGNTTEDNGVLQAIAAKLVRHQKTTDPAPRAIRITLPIEGMAYTFSRPVQVSENAALKLNLGFAKQDRTVWWRGALLIALLGLISWAVLVAFRKTGATK